MSDQRDRQARETSGADCAACSGTGFLILSQGMDVERLDCDCKANGRALGEHALRAIARARWRKEAVELLSCTVAQGIHATAPRAGEAGGARVQSIILQGGFMLRDILRHAEAVFDHADEQPDAGREPAARIYAEEVEAFLNYLGVPHTCTDAIRLTSDGLWCRYCYLLAAQPSARPFLTVRFRETDEGDSVVCADAAQGVLQKEAPDA